MYLDRYQKWQSKGFREEKITEGQTNNWAQFREPVRRFVSSFRSVASTNYPCLQSDHNIDRDHLRNHLWGLFTSQMWECRTDSHVRNYVLLAGMATGPALLERKQESPSSEQHATTLLHCYHCWPYSADLGRMLWISFLNSGTVHTKSTLLETYLMINLKFSRSMSADPDFSDILM